MNKIILCSVDKISINDKPKIKITYLHSNLANEKHLGFYENTNWFDDSTIFDKFSKEDFGKFIDADLGYTEPDYKGNCKVIINSIIVSGKTIKLI